MGSGRTDIIPPERVPEICRRMLRDFAPVYEAIVRRREHWMLDERADPVLDPPEGLDEPAQRLWKDASRFQVTEVMTTGRRLIDRICENPWQVEDFPPDEKRKDQELANAAGQVLASWGYEIEERQDMTIQRALAYPCVRDKGYSVLHVRRCEDLWPEIEWRYSEKHEGVKESWECPGCGGVEAEEGEDACPQCHGTGISHNPRLTLVGPRYVSEVQYEYARRGSPWTWESIDPLNFAWREDKDPRGGLRRALVHYEVDLEEYLDENENEIDIETLRAAAVLAGDRHSEMQHSTPSSDTSEGRRAIVYQLWTRTHLYEYVEGVGGGRGGVLVKSGEHGYPRIPFRIVGPRRTNHPDPMWRYECDMDAMYAIKPWIDTQVTLVGRISHNTAQPIYTSVVTDRSKVPYLSEPDGAPAAGSRAPTGASIEAQAMPGMGVEVITPPMPEAVVGFMQELQQRLENAKPDTGDADPQDREPWAIRFKLAQSGKGPRAHISEHARALSWAFQLIMDWHEQHNERMVAFPRDSQSRVVNSSAPVVVEPAQIRFHQPRAFINDVSAAEKQMELAFEADRLQRQLITHEDYYKVEGAKDPADRARQVRAYWVAQPYEMQLIQGKLAERMGSTFIVGPEGEMMTAAGQPVTPEQVLQTKGYQPAGGGGGASPQMGGDVAAQIRSQVMPPPLPALSGDTTAGLPDIPGIPAGVGVG